MTQALTWEQIRLPTVRQKLQGIHVFYYFADLKKTAINSGFKKNESGFQSGPGDSSNADKMAPFLSVTKSSSPSGGLRKIRQLCFTGERQERRKFSANGEGPYDFTKEPDIKVYDMQHSHGYSLEILLLIPAKP